MTESFTDSNTDQTAEEQILVMNKRFTDAYANLLNDLGANCLFKHCPAAQKRTDCTDSLNDKKIVKLCHD